MDNDRNNGCKVDSLSIDDKLFDDAAGSDEQVKDEEMTSDENHEIVSSVQCFLSLFNFTFEMDAINLDENPNEQAVEVPIEAGVLLRRQVFQKYTTDYSWFYNQCCASKE